MTALVLGFTGFYLLCRQSYRAASKAANALKAESLKAFTSINLFYKLQKLNVYRGVKQLHAGEKKAKVLMRLIDKRFAEGSITSLRFKHEIRAYAQQINQNLEQVVCNKESLSSINPKSWQDQIWQLRRAGSAHNNPILKELQQQLASYENLGKQYKELLIENDRLLAQMDKAILDMSKANYKLFEENSQEELTSDASFIRKFMNHQFNH